MVLGSLWSFLLLSCMFLFHPNIGAQGEISFSKSFDRFYRVEVTPGDAPVTRNPAGIKVKQKVDESSEVFRSLETEPAAVYEKSNEDQEENKTLSGDSTPVRSSPNTESAPKIPLEKYSNISRDPPAAYKTSQRTFSDKERKMKRSVGASYTENLDGSVRADAQTRKGFFLETVQGASNSRAEYRRTGQEARGSNPRQSEPYLDTSTFALSGDSAHNQAMVHWSGHNSSVILILTKLYDFNLGAVTESSLWRSTDYGSTYTKLNDKVGSRTVLSYLYVCPTNKRKIMMLSDPEVESAVLISSDEGASFEKYPINFNILSLLFHPTQENWILAYSHENKLYSSMDFGRKWQLVHENVMPGRFYWAVMGLDRESDVVHIEARIEKGRAQYVKCRAQRCSEGSRQYLFPGYVDTNSLVVQDEYVFTQVTKSGRPRYFASFMRESFKEMKLPKYCLPKDMHIISTDEKQVFAAVQEWNQNNTYSLYISDSPGVYFILSLENLRTSRGPAGNLLVDFYKIEGINGMYLANKLVDNHIKTFITYNKGQTWALLPAPATDVAGNNLQCFLPFCSLHLHLEMSENPYTSGPTTSKKSVPGIIIATGNTGTELSSTNLGMFITSDAGNSWRQIFDEEYNVWFLDNGGALLAVLHAATPIRHVWISLDEGKKWDRHSFSLAPLYVDGVLMEPESDNHIITFFGHFGHRSEWQLIKIDYKGLFNRKCMDGDYQTWYLHNKDELCVMGEKQIYMKRRPGNRCMLTQDYSRIYSSEPCLCTAFDFECDYGWERQADGKCSPAFWFNLNGAAKSCSTSQTFLNSTGYRKVLSNNCKEVERNMYSPKREACHPRAPRGLRLTTSHGELSATVGSNVTYMISLDEGESLSTSIQLDFGDGIKITYSNLSRTSDGIKHIYRTTGIYRVTASAENSQGSDSSVLFLHITSAVERIYLSAPIVAIRGKAANLTAVAWPSHSRTLTFFWWFDNSSEVRSCSSACHSFSHFLPCPVYFPFSQSSPDAADYIARVNFADFSQIMQNLIAHGCPLSYWQIQLGWFVKFIMLIVFSAPIITLEGSISHTFYRVGKNKVTLQVACGSTVMQDSKVITVKEFFRSLLLSFSPTLDEHNPDISEWREDIGRVVRTALSQQVSGVPEDQLLVSLYPGLPTTAELFILPYEHTSSEHKTSSEEELQAISDIFVTALNQGLVQFELKPDVHIIIYMTQQTLAPLVHSNSIHNGSAMLMLLSVVFVGLAAFFIYKFKRKIPWIHVQTEDTHEKEPEVISTVGQNDPKSKVKLSEFPSQKELMEKELEGRSRGGFGRNMERIVTREFPNCTNV